MRAAPEPVPRGPAGAAGRDLAGRPATAPLRGRALLARRIGRAPVAALGAAVVCAYLLAAAAAPVLAPANPTAMAPRALLAPPGPGHPFGTDQFGRDVLSRLLYGARVSLAVSFASVALALAAAGTAGLVGGYRGGALDGIVMRIMDVVFAFPAVLLAIAIMAVAGTTPPVLIVAIALVYTPQFARVSRGSAL